MTLQQDILKCVGWAAYAAKEFGERGVAHWTHALREIDLSAFNRKRGGPKWRPHPMNGGLGETFLGLAWQEGLSMSADPPIPKKEIETEWELCKTLGLMRYNRDIRGYELTEAGHDACFPDP